jgi:hypothetical protein
MSDGTRMVQHRASGGWVPAEEQPSPRDPSATYDQYGFRNRPDQTQQQDNMPADTPAPQTDSNAQTDPFGILGQQTKDISFLHQKKNQPKKPPLWLKILGTALQIGEKALLSGGLGGSGGGGGGGDTPDVSSTIDFPGLATGGPVKKGTSYLVGERGPELFTAHTSGRIIDHETSKRMAAVFGTPSVKSNIFSDRSSKAPAFATAAPKVQARAAGGDVSASNSYLVGENGPEILTGASGRIASNMESRRMMTNQKGGASYYIDARGTDPVQTEQRVRTALIQVHGSSVTSSLQAGREAQRRSPQRTQG